MAKKAPVQWHIAPLQRVVAEPITDPAETAAIDEMRKREKQRRRERRKALRKLAKAEENSAPNEIDKDAPV